jgi:hypothetical protein
VPKSHPEVTDATAKELYANAVNCAVPNCGLPLYRLNEDGSRTLNSRISHIHARQENGPRWNPEMSAEANRAASNLLLLCIEHADEIDQPRRAKLYPPGMLREWKIQQLALYDSLRTGWQISQDEAEEVIRESATLEVSIIAGTLNLGGSGGQAPSAGGGGGAAIGSGAKGGAGGPGGPTRINLRGNDGTAPGAGGGGAGYIDPDSPLFWHGGGQMPTFGESSFVGVDGQDGGDTTFGPVDDGKVVRAKGGIGGRVGSGDRSKSDKIVASSLMLANYVEFRDVFAYIIGAGFHFYNVLNLEDRLIFNGTGVLECGSVPVGEYALTVEAYDPENTVISAVTLVFRITQAGDILRIFFKFSLAATITMFGMWTIVLRHEGRELGRLPIVVKRGVPS